jgi:hypothetical protein
MTFTAGPTDTLDGPSDDVLGDGREPEVNEAALFAGDDGGLTYAQRRCLVVLLKARYISRHTHPEHWKVLQAHRGLLTSRLNDLFLTLLVDTEREVAYKRQAIPDDGESKFPTLLHDLPYSREETLLLVVLRERLQRERAGGAEIVSVDREDLLDAVAEFRSADTHDLVAEDSRIAKAIASLVKSKVLRDTSEDRFEITPVLDSLLPLERLRELLEWLRAANPTDSGDEGPS